MSLVDDLGAVFSQAGTFDFSGEQGDHVEIVHTPELELPEGTISLHFTADDVWGYHALFSKDFSGNRDGGDLTAFVKDGRVKIRFQSAEVGCLVVQSGRFRSRRPRKPFSADVW